jgi:hypothetical protein
MTNSEIHKDDVDWLISVVYTSQDEELRNESYDKLIDFGLDEEQINKRFKEIESDERQLKAFEKAWKKQVERNKLEKYTFIEKIKIFFFGPYELFRLLNSGLTELYESNYKIKFKQRLILLIAGTIFWILAIVVIFEYSEFRRINKIEKVDISDWEKNRIKDE